MSDHRARDCRGVGTCATGHTTESKGQVVPRVASSLDDLRVGQVVASYLPGGDPEIDGGTIEKVYSDEVLIRRSDKPAPAALYASSFYDTKVVILSDPPPEPVTVSREAFDRLAGEVEKMRGYYPAFDTVNAAARALVDEVRGQA